MQKVLDRPLITEKSLMRAQKGWYSFATDVSATKPMIAKAIEKLYAVTVVGVRTMMMHPKMHRVGRRSRPTAKPHWKKALVHLKEGQTISAFEVTQEGEKKK